ncbi:hypothetical protein ABZ173_32160 [Streptomyces rochei]|uniref:hypothetical protein n=1 Tax=Streptomyces rochei TaxID=1928 RepID=UPI0033A53ECF
MCANDYAADDIGWGLLLRRGEVANAYLWRSGRLRGYCVLIHRGAPHVAEPTDLSEADAAAYWRDTLALGRALTAFYEPVKLNFSTLGNVVPHLFLGLFRSVSLRIARGNEDRLAGRLIAGTPRLLTLTGGGPGAPVLG